MLRIVLENSTILGGVYIQVGVSTLEDVRNLINDELDQVPEEFVFVSMDAPIGRNQEHKRIASAYLPSIVLRPRYSIKPVGSAPAPDSYSSFYVF